MLYSEEMLRRFLLLAVPATLLLAADKPDYSGHWVVDLSKSDFGMMPPPEKMERDIEHKDPEIKIKTLQKGQRGEMTSESKYTTDGKEATIQVRGREAKVKANWNGSKLVVMTKTDFQGQEISQKETWSLSEDGKTLTINNEINSPMGEMVAKSVFTKGN